MPVQFWCKYSDRITQYSRSDKSPQFFFHHELLKPYRYYWRSVIVSNSHHQLLIITEWSTSVLCRVFFVGHSSSSIRPDVKFFCDVTYDPLLYMQRNNKIYGMTPAILLQLPHSVFWQGLLFHWWNGNLQYPRCGLQSKV